MNDHNEPMQELQCVIRFKVKMNPGNERHLKEVLRAYFRGKGVDFNGEEIYI